MIVRPWEKGDTEKLIIQDAQQYIRSMVDIETDFSELSDDGLAWTGVYNGEIMIVSGVQPIWENRALAWALVSKNAVKCFKSVHKAVYRFLIHAPFRRIEANVDVGFMAGHKWMTMLGFEVEGYMKAYRPDGADMILYSRVRQ